MIIAPKFLIDGSTSFEKGVQTQSARTKVPRNQLCNLVNATTRTDYIGPRPNWTQVALVFPDSETQTEFELGRFQGFTGYIPDTGRAHLVFSISGRLYRVDALSGGEVTELPLPDPNPTNRPQAWFKQAELFLIVQDGQSSPLIYDGASVFRSNQTGEGAGTDVDGVPRFGVPTGTVMEYSMGRLWVALPDGHAFVAGDGVYGPSGTEAYQSRDSILYFTENAYLNGGHAFAVPSNLGPIRAMKALANLDTSLGQGPMQVFTPSGAFSIQAPFDRELWALVQDPIKTVSQHKYGFLGQDNTVQVNGDLWGRSLNGISSFIIARRDFNTWGNRGMSHEVGRWLDRDDENLLQYGSGALFDDRLLMTVGPQMEQNRGVRHSGLVALDFHPITELGQIENPTWEGLWTVPFGDMLKIQSVTEQGIEHCFAVMLAPEDEHGNRPLQLWKLNKGRGPDRNTAGTSYPIERVIEGPAYDYSPTGSTRLEQKLLEAFDAWIDSIAGTVDFWLYYRPDSYPCWFLWKHSQVCAKTQRCSSDAIDGCLRGMNLQRQFRNRISFGRPIDYEVPGTNVPSRLGYTHQYRLEVIGDVDITAVRIVAQRIVEQTFGSIEPETAECFEIECCPEDTR